AATPVVDAPLALSAVCVAITPGITGAASGASPAAAGLPAWARASTAFAASGLTSTTTAVGDGPAAGWSASGLVAAGAAAAGRAAAGGGAADAAGGTAAAAGGGAAAAAAGGAPAAAVPPVGPAPGARGDTMLAPSAGR